MRILRAALPWLVAVLLSTSCRQTAPVDAQQPTETLTSYVGIASFSAVPTNVLIVASQSADAPATLSGSITYQSQHTDFAEITLSDDGDTLRFNYVRSNVLYRAWAVKSSVDLRVHFTEPTGIPVFRLNRETNGHNMTGIWNGEMSSTFAPGPQSVTLVMDQTGTVFTGETSVNFFEPWTFELSTGSVSGSAFELSGSVHGSSTVPTSWQGYYVGFDTLTGTWNAGGEAEIDGGEFFLSRWFQ